MSWQARVGLAVVVVVVVRTAPWADSSAIPDSVSGSAGTAFPGLGWSPPLQTSRNGKERKMPENSGTGEVGPRWYGQDPSPYYSTGLGGSTGDPNRPGSSLGSVDIAANPYESSQVARRDAHIDTGATAQMGQYPAAEPLSGVDLDGTGAGQGQPVSPPHPNSNGPGRM